MAQTYEEIWNSISPGSILSGRDSKSYVKLSDQSGIEYLDSDFVCCIDDGTIHHHTQVFIPNQPDSEDNLRLACGSYHVVNTRDMYPC